MIQADKIGHFVVGAGIAGATATVLTLTSCSIWWALVPVVCAAFGKEIYDYYHPTLHTVEAMDAVATILGGVSVISLITLITSMM